LRISDPSPGTRHVAVGPTRDAAARAFGRAHDDLFLTTYADLADEVDLTEVDSLDLATGKGQLVALEWACRRLHLSPGISLRIEHPPGDSAALFDILTRNSVTITDLQQGDGVLLLVIGVSDGPDSPAALDLLMQALDVASAALVSSATGHHSPTTNPATPGIYEDPPSSGSESAEPLEGYQPDRRKRPQPRLLRTLATVNQLRHGRRRHAVLLTFLVVLIVLPLLVAQFSDASTQLIGTLVSLQFVMVVGAIGLLAMSVLLLSRQVHVQTGRLERMVLRNRTIERQGAKQLTQQVGAVLDGQSHLSLTRDYLEALAAANSASSVRLAEEIQSVLAGVSDSHLQTQRQVQALLNLHQMIEIRGRIPPMAEWAASADFNVLVIQELLNTRPRTVVECGSGTSTLLLALAVRQYDLPTKVVALEHLEQFRAATQRSLEEHGVADLAEVRLAPLVPVSGLIPGHETPWYGEEHWSDLRDIGLLVVDGPPSTTGERPRHPAVPLLGAQLAAHAVIVVDDLDRAEDREVAESWRALLPDFDYEQVDALQKGAAVFRRAPD
jgi:hypothetical protein